MQSPAGDQQGSSADAIDRVPQSTRRLSPSQLLNLFCASTAALWIVLLASTFSDRLPLILSASVLWLAVTSLSIVLAVYLSQRRQPPKLRSTAIALYLVVWSVGTLVASNFLVEYWQSRQRLWTAFVFNARYGWYPEPHLAQHRLITPHGSYLASTDELGHRNAVPYPADGVLPIVVQGDSNAFGFGLNDDETLAAILNARLKQNSVFNLGIPGFDLNHYYYQYEDLSRRFKMQTRIILWNIGNDFTLSAIETPNYFRRPYLFVEAGKLRQAADFQAPFPVQGYGQTFVPPYRAYDGLISAPEYDWADIYPPFLIRTPLSRQLIRTYHPKLCRAVSLMRKQTTQVELYDPSWMLLKRELWPAPFDQFARDFPILLRALKQQNPRLILVPFPFREQIIPAELSARMQGRGYRDADVDTSAFNTFLKEVCAAEDIRLVDPLEAFQHTPSAVSLFQVQDQHLSAEGMKLCAQVLLDAGIETPSSPTKKSSESR